MWWMVAPRLGDPSCSHHPENTVAAPVRSAMAQDRLFLSEMELQHSDGDH
jgi:hypothetical protein